MEAGVRRKRLDCIPTDWRGETRHLWPWPHNRDPQTRLRASTGLSTSTILNFQTSDVSRALALHVRLGRERTELMG